MANIGKRITEFCRRSRAWYLLSLELEGSVSPWSGLVKLQTLPLCSQAGQHTHWSIEPVIKPARMEARAGTHLPPRKQLSMLGSKRVLDFASSAENAAGFLDVQPRVAEGRKVVMMIGVRWSSLLNRWMSPFGLAGYILM